MSVLADVAQALNEHGFQYVVFKTLRPFREEVADIDILCLGDDREYSGIVQAIGLWSAASTGRLSRILGIGLWQKVLIDVYREVSAGPLVYLDKQWLGSHVALAEVGSTSVKVLDPVAETFVTVGHSVVKEGKMILAGLPEGSALPRINEWYSDKRVVELAKSAKPV